MNLGGCDGGITTLLPFVTVLVAESGLVCCHGLPYLVIVEPKYPGKLRGATVRTVIGGWKHLRTLPAPQHGLDRGLWGILIGPLFSRIGRVVEILAANLMFQEFFYYWHLIIRVLF